MTAYVRAMSTTLDQADDFAGPMAKQHRMAVITCAALVGAAEAAYSGTQIALFVGLAVVIAGTVVTSLRRSRTLLDNLNRKI